jgi:hypothetical protein
MHFFPQEKGQELAIGLEDDGRDDAGDGRRPPGLQEWSGFEHIVQPKRRLAGVMILTTSRLAGAKNFRFVERTDCGWFLNSSSQIGAVGRHENPN